MPEAFLQLSITLGIALVISLVMKFLRQPLIIGYIITGIIVGPVATGLISEKETLEAFSHIGIALLLFIVGLGLKPKLIREVGKVAVVSGIGQIIFTSVGGFFLGQLLGFSIVVSLYLAVATTLSSTIIIIRLLYNKEEQDTLYGRISIGFLLVQDIVAMILFLVLTTSQTMGSGDFVSTTFVLIGKMFVIAGALYLLMKYITPRVDKIFAENKEMLFIFAIGVCFVIATAFHKLGFSFELGALAAGVILSASPYQREIATRIQSLRDFFLIIFFIVMGANIGIGDFSATMPMVLLFSAFILIGNPIIMTIIMRLMKYTVKTSFLSALTVSQISEFSLILIGMGVGLGHVPANLLGPITLVGLITITISSYYITFNHQIYKFLKPVLNKIFRQTRDHREKVDKHPEVEVILFGCHITGGGILKEMKKTKTDFVAIDHDPEIISSLSKQGVPAIFGSADDSELLDAIPSKDLKLVISTVPEFDVNSFLLTYFKKRRRSVSVLCVANHFADAERLYKLGATYVIMPPYLGRRFITDLFIKNGLNKKKYIKERKRHIVDYKYLEDKFV